MSPSLWGRSKLIENTLLAGCLDFVGNYKLKQGDVLFLSSFQQIPVAYIRRVDRCKFFMAKHLGMLVVLAYLMSTALIELDLFDFSSKELKDMFGIVFLGGFVQYQAGITFLLIIVILLCLASFMQSMYIIPRYYACLNLPSAINKPKDVNRMSLVFRGFFGAGRPWFLYKYNPERRVPILLQPFVGMARINKIDEFIAFRSHAREPAE